MKLYVCYGTFSSPRPGGHPCGNALKELTGSNWVPVLVTDDGEVVADSKNIVEWAKAHPAGAGEGATA
jgi:glutathione S-transferase